MHDLYEIGEILAEIRNTGSTIMKEDILIESEDVKGFKEVLQFIYDPYFTTGIGIKKLESATISAAGEEMCPEEMMGYLKENNTGSMQAAAIANGFIYAYSDDDDAMWLAEGIVTKELKIGVSVTTLNKVFGKGFIPMVGIMRGVNCPEYITGSYIVTEKIDGNRRLLMNKETGPEIYTRSGKRDFGLVEIEEQMKSLPIGYVYDTECIAMGKYEDSIALRQASASLLNRGGDRTGVKALVFDMIPIAEYNEGRSSWHALARKAMLAILFDDIEGLDTLKGLALKNDVIKHLTDILASNLGDDTFSNFPLNNIDALPILGIVTSKEQAIDIATPIWETGGEGVMLAEHKSVYEVSPNPRKTLLKVKLLKEFVCKVIGIAEGTNKYEGMLGSVVVEYERDGEIYSVNVGSGFTDLDRRHFWDNPTAIINKNIEIESFGESMNAQGGYSINCPIYKRIVGDVD